MQGAAKRENGLLTSVHRINQQLVHTARIRRHVRTRAIAVPDREARTLSTFVGHDSFHAHPHAMTTGQLVDCVAVWPDVASIN